MGGFRCSQNHRTVALHTANTKTETVAVIRRDAYFCCLFYFLRWHRLSSYGTTCSCFNRLGFVTHSGARFLLCVPVTLEKVLKERLGSYMPATRRSKAAHSITSPCTNIVAEFRGRAARRATEHRHSTHAAESARGAHPAPSAASSNTMPSLAESGTVPKTTGLNSSEHPLSPESEAIKNRGGSSDANESEVRLF